jgi:hypothetical protein
MLFTHARGPNSSRRPAEQQYQYNDQDDSLGTNCLLLPWFRSGSNTNIPGHRGGLTQPKVIKKADVAENPKVFDHVGLLLNEPPGEPGCSLSSHPTTSTQLFSSSEFKCTSVPLTSLFYSAPQETQAGYHDDPAFATLLLRLPGRQWLLFLRNKTGLCCSRPANRNRSEFVVAI